MKIPKIILMVLHGLSKITVLKLDTRKTPLEQAADLTRQKTDGNTLLPDIPNNDTAVHGQATQILKVYNNFKSKPPTSTKGDMQIELDKAEALYNPNAAYIEAQARIAATTTGNLNSGINLVDESGYYMKSPRSAVSSGFYGECEGAGSIKISTKAVAPHAIYVRQYGLATAEGVVPETTEELLIGSEATIFLEGVQRLKVYAFREAYILPITRKPEDAPPETKLEKKATKKLITSAHRRVFNINNPSQYKWGPWIWVTTV